MAFRALLPPATLVYMTHSAVVIRFEKALPLRTREKGGGRERPPPKTGGSCGPAQMAFGTCLCTGPHGVAHVLIYPCGKAQNRPPFPSRFIVSDRSSPSRVRFAASRPGLLRAVPHRLDKPATRYAYSTSIGDSKLRSLAKRTRRPALLLNEPAAPWTPANQKSEPCTRLPSRLSPWSSVNGLSSTLV